MPLPALTWRRAATVNVAVAGNVNSILDAIWTAAGSSIYWTWGRDTTNPIQAATTAVYAEPVSPTALNQRVIWAGTTTAAGLAWQQYTLSAADARNASQLYVGCAKNGGAYTNWNGGGTPFTTGQFTGFAMAGSVATVDRVTLLESPEAIIVLTWRSAASTMAPSIAGAFVDPLSTSSGLAESDGRVYGVSSIGTSTLTFSWLGQTVGATWLSELATSALSRFGVLQPGGSTIVSLTRPVVCAPTTSLVTRAATLGVPLVPEVPLIPVSIINTSATTTAFVGKLREIYVVRDAINNQTLIDASVAKGYVIGASTTGNADAVMVTV